MSAAKFEAHVRFEEPPQQTHRDRRSQPHIEAANALRERSGEWGIILTTDTFMAASSLASSIRHGRLAAYSDGAFEAVARTVDGEHRVYARHAGGAA